MLNSKNNDMLLSIGVIGLGDMGLPIARNLITLGYNVEGFDVKENNVKLMVAAGGKAGLSVVDLVKNNDIVLTLLPSSETFVSVAEKELIPNAREGQIFIEIGTTIPDDIRTLEKLFNSKGAHLLDTPVSGGKIGAERAQLKVFVGGDKVVFEKCRPLLEAIAGPNTIYYCGKSGMGQAMKGVNQLQAGMINAVCLEILSFAVHSGLSLELIQEAFPEPIHKTTIWIAERISEGIGNQIGVKFRELPYYIREAQILGFDLPLTKLVYEYCNKGERIVIDDHRPAPSFWHELNKNL